MMGYPYLEVDPRHRATILQIARLKEQDKLGWREISELLEAPSAAAEGRKPPPRSQRQWSPRNARRCCTCYQVLLLRPKINGQWRRAHQGGGIESLARGPG
jgi:hypothetical protein